MRTMPIPAAVAALALAAALCSPLPAQATLEGSKLKKGQAAPDFTLNDVDGKTWKLSDLKGKKIVMLDFWATWCNICKREMPVLERVYKEYKGKGVEFFGIALDDADKIKQIKKILSEKGVTYPILIDQDQKVATEVYQLAGPIPFKVVIDLAGTIVYDHVGDYVDYPPEIVDVFDQLLEAQPLPKKK
ncbi:MAG TPA: TlpA disulfide reductase family protein [Candidatus Methanoperedens sp.]|nr:TlpA disulfide reductase family protein [Candidatus Methanoperedens sp.]